MDCVIGLGQPLMDTISGSNKPLGIYIFHSLESHGHSRFVRVPKLSEIDIIAQMRDTAASLAVWNSLPL